MTCWLPVFLSRRYFLSAVARVWNEAAAHRLTTLGHSARRGDLVWLPGEQLKAEGTEETTLPQVMHTDGSHVIRGNSQSGNPLVAEGLMLCLTTGRLLSGG